LARTVYAMDTSFYTSLGAYDFEARCEILRELGYDATYLTLWSDDAWADVPRLATVRERYGLDVTAVYVTLDIATDPHDPANRRILELVDTIEGCRTIELSVRSSDPELPLSDPRGDEAARRWLSVLLERAEGRGITLALYPHIRFWMERMEDAVRLCRAVDHPLLRMVFPTYHWYAADGKGLAERVAEAAPYLVLANVCGSRRYDNGSGLPATIEPLDEGELDVFAVLGQLQAAGFIGPIGVQGYSVAGDVYAKLRRSLVALRDIERRLDTHPDWARLRPPLR
jgi:sugar phosphate isomerase/epimerase